MLSTQELMIGNYVRVDKKICKVDEIFQSAVGLNGSDSLKYELVLEPVALTKDLLLKNGFKETTGKFHKEFCLVLEDTVHLYCMDNEWKVVIDGNFFWLEWYGIKYVHQLQNLCTIHGVKLDLNL